MQRDEKCNEYKIGNAQENKIYDIVQILGVSITIAHSLIFAKRKSGAVKEKIKVME